MRNNHIKFQSRVAVFVLGIALLGAAIAGISLYAQDDPDKQLYDNDILFQALRSGGQTWSSVRIPS